MTDSPKCQEPGCGLPLVMGLYQTMPYSWHCPRETDAHKLCARVFELSSEVERLKQEVEEAKTWKAGVLSSMPMPANARQDSPRWMAAYLHELLEAGRESVASLKSQLHTLTAEKAVLEGQVVALREALKEIVDRGPTKRMEPPRPVGDYMFEDLGNEDDRMEAYAWACTGWSDQLNASIAQNGLDEASATAQQVRAEIEREAGRKFAEIAAGITCKFLGEEVYKGNAGVFPTSAYFEDAFRAAILGEKEGE